MAKKTALKRKTATQTKEKASRESLLRRGGTKAMDKSQEKASPELKDTHERVEWQKERRVYWSSRFRRMLEEITTKPKAKKASAL